MEKKKVSIKSTLLKLFNEGKSETEALEEVSKTHSSCNVSEKTVNTWYGKFKAKNQDLDNSKVTGSRKKFSDEFLIDLVSNNPDFSMNRLAKLAETSAKTISNRIKQLNGDERLNYKFKDNLKFSDEFLIDLINNNSDLSMEKLANIAGVSRSAIFNRIKQLKCGNKKISYCGKNNLKITDKFLIGLIDKNPKLSMEKLANIAGVSRSAINNRIRQLKSGNEKVNYYGKNLSKFSDEFLIDLVNKNPTLDLKELAKLAGTTPSTVSYRIKQINSKGVRVNYVKKKYIPDGYNTSNSKLTYELLNDLINSNPDLNMHELAGLAGVSAATIGRKIKKFNKAGKTLNYCKKDTKKLTDEFLTDFIDKNPDFNTNELSQLAGISTSAISSRIKHISGGEGVKYSFKENTKLTNERLIDLMNENPGLSMAKLAKLAGTSATTISRKIKQINSSGVVINHTIKYKSKQKPTTSEK